MTNTGTTWERFVRKYLESNGYSVIRAAGSRGIADLLAWNRFDVLVIQCKKGKRRNGYPDDKMKLRRLVVPESWTKQFWTKTNGSVEVENVITGEMVEISLRKMKVID